MTDVFDNRACSLGEGPFWHPDRNQLFWFDILGKRLLTQSPDGPQEWHFPELVSAAGVIDRDTLNGSAMKRAEAPATNAVVGLLIELRSGDLDKVSQQG